MRKRDMIYSQNLCFCTMCCFDCFSALRSTMRHALHMRLKGGSQNINQNNTQHNNTNLVELNYMFLFAHAFSLLNQNFKGE